MIEEVPHRFGDDDRLVGLVTRPRVGAGPVGVVLVNAGVIHRVGPHRSAVKLARAIAPDGFTVLRFDLSGVGDSRPATAARSYHAQAVEDIRAALDLLGRQYQVREVVLFGICSGAVHALATALADDRVTGLVMVDGPAYPTWKTPLETAWALARTLPPGALARRLLRQGVRWLVQWPGTRRAAEDDLWLMADARATDAGDTPPATGRDERHPPPGTPLDKAAFRRVMQALVARGTRVYLIYSGSVRATYGYADQMRDTYGHPSFLRHVQLDFFPTLDHTLTTLEGQRTIERAVRQWLPQAVADPAGPAAGPDAGTRAVTGAPERWTTP
jgi:pimeloyl-ACP methyl ester carboxylesterase